MSEHQDHEGKADDVERELDEMQERAGKLGDQIESTQDDWESKKRDASVPGAAGMPSEAGGQEPETEYPTKGDPDEHDDPDALGDDDEGQDGSGDEDRSGDDDSSGDDGGSGDEEGAGENR